MARRVWTLHKITISLTPLLVLPEFRMSRVVTDFQEMLPLAAFQELDNLERTWLTCSASLETNQDKVQSHKRQRNPKWFKWIIQLHLRRTIQWAGTRLIKHKLPQREVCLDLPATINSQLQSLTITHTRIKIPPLTTSSFSQILRTRQPKTTAT